MKTILRLALAPALALAFGIGPAAAQDDFDIEVVNAGKASADVEVILLANAGKVDLGTTSGDGIVRVPADATALPVGTPVDVYRIECDETVVVVLVGPGERQALEEECERRRRENPDCECDRIGGFLWGDDVTIDVGTGSVSQATADRAEAPGNLTLGFSFDLRQMVNLDDVAGEADGAIDASATGWAPGFQLFAEYRFRNVLSLGLEGAYSAMEAETSFAQGVQTVDLDYYELGGALKLGVPMRGPVRPYAVVALYRTWNHADFALAGLTDHRVHKTRRDGLGLGFDYRVTPRVGLRFEGLYNTTFEDGDADEHVRWRLGFHYTPTLDY